MEASTCVAFICTISEAKAFGQILAFEAQKAPRLEHRAMTHLTKRVRTYDKACAHLGRRHGQLL